MSLVGLGGSPLNVIGHPGVGGSNILPGLTNTLSPNIALSANYFIGQIFTEDGAAHTIDTTGSSSLGWRCGSLTFANAGTSIVVGLAAVDASNGPPGRPANSSGTFTFDVSKSLTGGGGGISGSAWNEHVPDTGSKTIAHGDLVAFAIQMVTHGGSDTIQALGVSSIDSGVVFPFFGFQNGASSFAGTTLTPNATITFNDGTLGFFIGGYVAETAQTFPSWNNTSTLKEYGNFFQMPAPISVAGAKLSFNAAQNCDVVLYSDPLGTPVAKRTLSINPKTPGAASFNSTLDVLFSSPYEASANEPLALIMKPTTSSNIQSVYKTYAAAAHQKSESLGANCYAINRNTGAFAAQNSGKDRFGVGLLVGAFDAGGGGSAAVARAGLHAIGQGISA